MSLYSYYKTYGLDQTARAVRNRFRRYVNNCYPFQYRYPLTINVKIMTVCNIRCKHCWLEYLEPDSCGANGKFMDYGFFERLVENLSEVIKKSSYFAFPSVEALFHKRIFDMIDLVRSCNKNITIEILTNGMLLDEKRIENLLQRKVHYITVSLDGCKKETVETFKTGVDFNRVISNIRKLRQIGGDKILLRTIIVSQKDNINELLEYVDFCANLGVKKITVTGMTLHSSEMSDYCLYSKNGMKDVDALYRKARKKALTLGIDLSFKGTKLEPIGCGSSMSSSMYIDINGDIVPCLYLSRKAPFFLLGQFGTTEPVIWGNVLADDPYKIWTSDKCIRFRRILYERKLPRECNLCPLGYNVIC